jgi:hypothetical protein
VANILSDTATLANLAQVAALLFLAFQAAVAARQLRSDSRRQRADRSLSFIRRWNESEFADDRRALLISLQRLEDEQCLDFGTIRDDLAFRGSVHNVLSFFDELALARRGSLLDDDLVFDYFHAVLAAYYRDLHFYVEEIRQRSHDPAIWKDVEALHGAFRDRAQREGRHIEGRYWHAETIAPHVPGHRLRTDGESGASGAA